MNVRRTSAAALSAALTASSVLLAPPASATAPCDAVTVSSVTKSKMGTGNTGTQRLRFLGVECHPQDTLQRIRWSYGDLDVGPAYCAQLKGNGITVNVGEVGGYNPPTVKVPCDEDGAGVEIPFPDSTFKPGNTDRCAGAHVKINRGLLKNDVEFDVPKACFPA